MDIITLVCKVGSPVILYNPFKIQNHFFWGGAVLFFLYLTFRLVADIQSKNLGNILIENILIKMKFFAIIVLIPAKGFNPCGGL